MSYSGISTTPSGSILFGNSFSSPQHLQQTIIQFGEMFHPQSYHCAYRFFFYNKVPPEDVPKWMGKPTNCPDELWIQACRMNPDQKYMVPAQVTSFDQLEGRIKEQRDMLNQQKQVLSHIKNFIANARKTHELEVSVKIQEYKKRSMDLFQWLLKIMVKLEVVRAKGFNIFPEEEALFSRLDNIQRELNKPNQYKSRLNEAISYLRMQEDVTSNSYPSLSDEDLENIQTYISEQSKGLNFLTDQFKKDLSILNIITSKMYEDEDEMDYTDGQQIL